MAKRRGKKGSDVAPLVEPPALVIYNPERISAPKSKPTESLFEDGRLRICIYNPDEMPVRVRPRRRLASKVLGRFRR